MELGGIRVKHRDEKEIVLLLLSVLIGRVQVLQMNPFSVGFFAAVCSEGLPAWSYALALSVGIWNTYGLLEMIKYINPTFWKSLSFK